MTRSKDIGTTAETAVVKCLRTHGWPHAERRALAGTHDLGDITGCPGLVIEVKSGRAAETASDGLIQDWLDETERERLAASADIGVLITKRPGYGPARAASWWAIVDMITWVALTRGHTHLGDALYSAPVRLHLSTLLPLLHAAGYGTPTPAPDMEVPA